MDVYIGLIMVVPFDFAPNGFAMCAGQTIPISQNQALFALLGNRYGGDGKSTYNLPDLRGRTVVGAFASGGPSPAANYALAQSGGALTADVTGIPPHTHTATASLSLSGLTASGDVNIPASTSLTNQDISVQGTLPASTDAGSSERPFTGATFGDPTPGTQRMYIAPPTDPAKTVQLAPITSTGKLTASATGSAQGNISLGVSGSATGTITVQPAGTGATVNTVSPFLALNNIIATVGIFPSRP